MSPSTMEILDCLLIIHFISIFEFQKYQLALSLLSLHFLILWEGSKDDQ